VKLGLGRVVPAPAREDDTTRPRRAVTLKLGRAVPAEVVQASEQARGIVARAEERSRALVAEAEAQAAALKQRAAAEAHADVVASFAARELALRARERKGLEDRFDDVVTVARLLAERLLGEELRLDPARITALARQALTEARGAEQLKLVAHPDDAPLLERALRASELDGVTAVVAEPTRARGSLRLETELGALDAELAPQLERLAAKLREGRGNG
jgi:flagellar biosynthesis/type III secretory pathway protein FliH